VPCCGEEQSIQVEPKGKEDDGKDKHDMGSIAHSYYIIKDRAERNAEVCIKVGKHVIQGALAKQEVCKEAGGNVNTGAQEQ
jgi:hypothetical protein